MAARKRWSVRSVLADSGASLIAARPPDRWVRTYEDGSKFLELLDGVDWLDAPTPPAGHACVPQLRATFSAGGWVYRCACGAISYDAHHWTERNTKMEG